MAKAAVRRSVTRLVYDSFTGTGVLTSHTPDVAPVGSAWTVLNGTFGNLAGGRLPYTSGQAGVAVINAGAADVDVSALVRADGSGVIVRSLADATKRLLIWPDAVNGQLAVRTYSALGVGSTVAGSGNNSCALTAGQDYTLEVRGYGNLLRLYLDRTYLLDYWDTAHTANTYHGVGTYLAGVGWDEFTVQQPTWRRLLIFGDSISYHADTANAVKTVIASALRWDVLLAAQYYSGRTFAKSRAVNGAAIIPPPLTASMAEEIATASAAGDTADVIFVAFGTNDYVTTNGIQAAYQANLQSIKAAWPGVPVYCLGLFGTTGYHGWDVSANVATMNGWIQTAAVAEGATYVDPAGWIDPATDTLDGYHPSAAGHAKIAAAMLAVLEA